jgi:thiamine-phosphate pyrophosphorylase
MVLYAITDRTWLVDKSLAEQVEEAIQGGATFIQLREKNLSFVEFLSVANDVKKITDKYKIPFVINDNVDVAVSINADGVHIGQDDEEIKEARKKLGINKIIGMSAHSVEEALKAEKNGADYIGVGAVFNTSTKLDADYVDFETLKNICLSVNIPVVAIGGINENNILKLKGSGIDGVSVISAIFAKPDIKKAARSMFKLSNEVVNNVQEEI